MNGQEMDRRRFLRVSALGSGALVLVACGADGGGSATVVEEPPAQEESPPAEEPAGSEAVTTEESVLISDVVDYALSSNEWPGAFGFVTFRLHEARYDGEPLYYIRTDSSDKAFADQEGLVYVPLLGAATQAEGMNALYTFEDGRPACLASSPTDEGYTSLCQLRSVALTDNSLELDSVAAIEQAVADGQATVSEQNVYVNYPVVKWPGGELSVDPVKEVYLGEGQLLAPPDLDAMTVTMKLHGCFPGTRYIISDTSAVPMAPMMAVPASSPTLQLNDLNATDEIWVFGNGIPGPGVMGFQPGVFDNQAGEAAWSPFWNHFTLLWKDESQARVLRTGDEIRAALEAGEIEQFNGTPDSHPNGFVVNCPVPVIAPTVFEA